MQRQASPEGRQSVLTPTVPPDIGARSQRRRILDAMIDSCATKTYAATTISDIVARARISRTTFYKHFPDKRACFDAAISRCLEELEAVAAKAHVPSDNPSDAARQAATAILRHLGENPQIAQLICGDALAVDRSFVESYRQVAVPALERLWGGGDRELEPHTDPGIAFAQAQLLIFDKIASGRPDQLGDLLPQIVYLAVAPFAGHDQGVAQSLLARREAEGSDADR